jgi:hypothetical protein
VSATAIKGEEPEHMTSVSVRADELADASACQTQLKAQRLSRADHRCYVCPISSAGSCLLQMSDLLLHNDHQAFMTTLPNVCSSSLYVRAPFMSCTMHFSITCRLSYHQVVASLHVLRSVHVNIGAKVGAVRQFLATVNVDVTQPPSDLSSSRTATTSPQK